MPKSFVSMSLVDRRLVTITLTLFMLAFVTSARASAQSWSYTGSQTTARSGHTATLLSNGEVLIVGGTGTNGAVASAELYNPPAHLL
jgi:hypothetical protein